MEAGRAAVPQAKQQAQGDGQVQPIQNIMRRKGGWGGGEDFVDGLFVDNVYNYRIVVV